MEQWRDIKHELEHLRVQMASTNQTPLIFVTFFFFVFVKREKNMLLGG